jgi:molybdopterin molybdotransferase
VNRHLQVSSGEAVRIFTGAPIPDGADAVVMQEDVTAREGRIVLNVKVEPGEFVRRRGCDLSEGQKIVTAGERIRATTMPLLASQGLSEVAVGGAVAAAVVSTGDELVKLGTTLQPGQIYESNSILLKALLDGTGADVRSIEQCADDRDALTATLQSAITCDVAIVSGGVSVGEHDLVQSVLRSLGAKIDLWRVAIKPGKPFLFARVRQSQPSPAAALSASPSGRGEGEGNGEASGECFVFGLPGNPVSSFVTFLRLVQPAILKMMGASQLELPRRRAQLGEDISNQDTTRPHYVRGKLEGGVFTPIGRQESHALFGLSRANALLRVPASSAWGRGEEIEVEIWD